jgi:hypothetical protein
MFLHTENWPQTLKDAYALVPATRCRRKIHCCSMLPEMTWIESLSGQFPDAHHAFRQSYFSDLSFLVASLIFGMAESVKMKFNVVKEIVMNDNREKLNTMINECSDLFADMNKSIHEADEFLKTLQ